MQNAYVNSKTLLGLIGRSLLQDFKIYINVHSDRHPNSFATASQKKICRSLAARPTDVTKPGLRLPLPSGPEKAPGRLHT